VDGAAVLTGIADFIRRHVSLPDEVADTVALWIVVTWIHAELEISPFLNITSATKRCGKSLLLEALGEFVHRRLPVGGRVTPAALFRVIEAHAPTLLLDEADTYFRDDPELRGVVNGSQRRSSAYILRSVGEDHEPRQFVTWCPKAIAGIGALPDTVLDRSIVLRLERRSALARWRDRDRGAVETLHRQLARWIGDNEASIVAGLPTVEFPSGLHDRARDAWEALLAIGNVAGGAWAGRGGRAWRACEHVAASAAGEETGAREMLLADLRDIFEAGGWPAALASRAILDRLIAMEGRPWGEWSRGKPLSAHGLSKLLKLFGIAPRNIRIDGAVVKGYERAAFEDTWSAYFPESPGSQSATSLQPHETSGFRDSQSATHASDVADSDSSKSLENKRCSDVAVLQTPSRGNGAESAPAPVSLPWQPPGTVSAGAAYRIAKGGE